MMDGWWQRLDTLTRAEPTADIVPLGELVKQDLLGHGAMCQVFQAHWTPKNIPVALKQVSHPRPLRLRFRYFHLSFFHFFFVLKWINYL